MEANTTAVNEIKTKLEDLKTTENEDKTKNLNEEDEECHDGGCGMGEEDVEDEKTDPPFIIENAFDPKEILGCEPSAWMGVIRSVSPKLPAQVHCEPFAIKNGPNEDTPAIFKNVCKFLNTVPEFAPLMVHDLPNGEPSRARIKLRYGSTGKFIHRNRSSRKQILLCLEGVQTWLFLSSYGGASDKLLNMATNKHWCGYRSARFTNMMTVDQMKEVAANVPEGVEAKIVTFKAGDAMIFDARWWHGTSYNTPVLIMFFTPGLDMEDAVKEHKIRHGRESHQKFQLCKISMAKTAKLASTWKKDDSGKDIEWEKHEGYVQL